MHPENANTPEHVGRRLVKSVIGTKIYQILPLDSPLYSWLTDVLHRNNLKGNTSSHIGNDITGLINSREHRLCSV